MHTVGPAEPPLVLVNQPTTPGDASGPPAPSLPATVIITPIVELSPPEEKKVISHAQKEIVKLLLTQNAMPLPTERDSMMAVAMGVAMRSVIGQAVVAQPKAATKQMMEAMSAVRQLFKKYCSHNLHNQFELHRLLGDG